MICEVAWDLEVLEEASSTQDLVKARADQGAHEGLCIQALTQSGGYGRHGRNWIGLPGNLFLSFVLRPGCQADEAGPMSLVVGEALAASIRPMLNDPAILTLKWPNDVLLAGEKCAGILIESSLKGEAVEWLAVGIGVNVASAPDGPFTALSAHCAEMPEVAAFRDQFLANMALAYSRWQKDGIEAIRAEWQRMD